MESSTITPDVELGEQTYDSFGEQVKAQREAVGLDPESALPVAADDDGREMTQLTVTGEEVPLMKVGGKRASGVKLRFVGGAFEVTGGKLPKGGICTFEVKCRIAGEHFDDKIDSKTGQSVDCGLTLPARVLGAVRIEQSALDKLDALTLAVQEFLAGDIDMGALAEQVAGA